MVERPIPPGGPAGPEADWSEPAGSSYSSADLPPEGRTIPLRQEELVAHKELRHIGDVEIRTEVEHVPGHVELEAEREEVEVEHVPVGRVVSERDAPYQDGDVLVVPIYEEQMVVTKRLVLREELRIRRVASKELHVFEETLRRERVVVEDAEHTGALHELYPSEDSRAGERHEGFLDNIRRKVMQP